MNEETCERCKQQVARLYAIEIRGRIKGWICEACYFKQVYAKRRKERTYDTKEA